MTKSIQKALIYTIVLFLGASGWITALASGDVAPLNFATVIWSGNQISFFPRLRGEVVLAVSGPDFSWRKASDSMVVFEAKEATGEPLPDGSYGFELREVVVNTETEALKKE